MTPGTAVEGLSARPDMTYPPTLIVVLCCNGKTNLLASDQVNLSHDNFHLLWDDSTPTVNVDVFRSHSTCILYDCGTPPGKWPHGGVAPLPLMCFTHVGGSSHAAPAPRSPPPRRGRSDRSCPRSARKGIPDDAAAAAAATLSALAPAPSTCARAAGSFCLGRPPSVGTPHSWRCSRRAERWRWSLWPTGRRSPPYEVRPRAGPRAVSWYRPHSCRCWLTGWLCGGGAGGGGRLRLG